LPRDLLTLLASIEIMVRCVSMATDTLLLLAFVLQAYLLGYLVSASNLHDVLVHASRLHVIAAHLPGFPCLDSGCM
jgi:hypothetical protein